MIMLFCIQLTVTRLEILFCANQKIFYKKKTSFYLNTEALKLLSENFNINKVRK